MQFPAYLQSEIDYLKGVGPARGQLLREELGISTFYDLLNYFPFRYVDKSQISTIQSISKDTDYIQLVGRISTIECTGFKGRKRLSAQFRDQTGQIELIWFQGVSYLQDILKEGYSYKIYGKPSWFKRKLTIAHPEIELFTPGQPLKTQFEPIYSTTEKLKKKGLDSRGIAKLTRELFNKMARNNLPEIFNALIRQENKIPERWSSYRAIHFPKSYEEIECARYRIKFEDFFFHQLSVLQLKLDRYDNTPGPQFSRIAEHFNHFYHEILPFELTGAQKRVLKEIRYDVAHGRHMNRLVQGDVGSGKTMVALMTALMAIDNGYQAALMAPTEILAQQHYEGIKELLEPLQLKVALLTGNIKGERRRSTLAALKTGHIDLLIGTHALIEDPVQFKNLGIAIIDEQHRFGVAQRAKLWQKRKENMAPHILVMTATPIPRTLAMTNMGDLDVSVIDELPPGRKPIKTLHKTEAHRDRLFGFIKEEIQKGRQVYIVYPLIEESEKLDLKDLFSGFNDLGHYFPYPEYRTSVVHGRMKPAEKEAEMQRFAEGTTQIMVATTVIEVGVNVPNASVMVIENASRFGLSQLHQLRGRVGRGAEQSYCILMTKSELNQNAQKRMQTMVKTNDGFKIAEVDLELRGPGEIEGTRQSGAIQFRLADVTTDANILKRARSAALKLLQADRQLTQKENEPLKYYLQQMAHQKNGWSKIS